LPNGVVTTSQYDGLNRLTRLTHAKGANTLADFQYQFNGVSSITQMTDGAGAHNYTYDSRDRLTAATHPNQTNEGYTYDDVGNRTASHQGSSYSYQAFNRLVTANSNTYTYDTNGNLISTTEAGGSWTYIWDYENRLKQVSESGGVTVTYAYDALGRRIQRTSSIGGTTKFIYDGSNVVRDLDASGNSIADYLNAPGIDNHLRQTSAASGVSYLLTDQLGSTAALTDGVGNIVEQLAYDSFGYRAGSSLTRYTYTGREQDPDTGMMYYRARFYDPRVGRFISEDPIGLGGDINQYAYVENQPTNAIDPVGLQRLAPLGRNGRSRVAVPREEFEKKMLPPGHTRLPDSIKRELDRGCVGLTAAYQGMAADLPEDAPGTHCYLEFSLANARKCPRGRRNFVFSKMGDWRGGVPPPVDSRTGETFRHAISNDNEHFNYVIYFPSTKSFAWMDFARKYGDQWGYVQDHAPISSRYPNTIWCSTCIPQTRRR
jgi:RHS repeat-associated protein